MSLVQAPQWVLDQIIVKDDQQQKISPPVTEKDWGGTLYEGQRNEGLARQIGSLVGRGMPKEQVMEFSVIWNNHHCQPPLPQEEVETIVESIFMREKMQQAKKGRTTTEPSQKGFKPTPFIKQFIFHQQEMGYQWKYSVEMGAFFRCDITKGPWQLIDLDYVKREIRLALINEERTGQAKWDSVHCISESIEAFKAELVASNHCDFFDMGYAIKYGGWERHPLEIISLKNGILEWQTNKLLPWNSKIYTTIQLPVEYDPKADCPTWKEALQSWIGDDTTISFLQEFIGLCLIPDTSFDTAVFLYGVGSNGKSMFLDTVRTLFGNALTAIPLHKLATRFETVYIQNKLVNICGDIDAKYISDTGVLKSIITGDTIEGEFKHGKSFWFTPVCRLMFSANSLPGVSDKTIGWIRRWKFIEFPNTFATNPSYKISHTTMFGKEKNGIFNWALEGLQRLKGNNTWTLSEKMKESEAEYRNINDNVSAFLAEVVERVDYDSTQLTLLPVTPLHKYYVEWLDSNINGTQPVSINEFSKRISSNNFTKGIRTVNGKSSNVFFGMRIKEQYLDEYRIWSGF
jgi:putative DNA primase/helicase